jgi:hypothetical protein
MGGRHGHGGHERHQIRHDDSDAMAHRLFIGGVVLTGHRQTIVEKRQMKLAGFQYASDVLVVVHRHEAGGGLGMAP